MKAFYTQSSNPEGFTGEFWRKTWGRISTNSTQSVTEIWGEKTDSIYDAGITQITKSDKDITIKENYRPKIHK